MVRRDFRCAGLALGTGARRALVLSPGRRYHRAAAVAGASTEGGTAGDAGGGAASRDVWGEKDASAAGDGPSGAGWAWPGCGEAPAKGRPGRRSGAGGGKDGVNCLYSLL